MTGSDVITGETLKKAIIPILHKILRKIEGKGSLPSLFYETSISLTRNQKHQYKETIDTFLMKRDKYYLRF